MTPYYSVENSNTHHVFVKYFVFSSFISIKSNLFIKKKIESHISPLNLKCVSSNTMKSCSVMVSHSTFKMNNGGSNPPKTPPPKSCSVMETRLYF